MDQYEKWTRIPKIANTMNFDGRQLKYFENLSPFFGKLNFMIFVITET